MTVTCVQAAAAGLAAGLFNGFIVRRWLRARLRAADPSFFLAFAFGLLYKLVFLLFSFWLLHNQKSIIVIYFIIPLLLAQVAAGLIPLSKNGTERNS